MITSSCAPESVPLFRLATSPKHQFPLNCGRYIAADKAAGRGARIERACPVCGAVKITAFLAGGGGERRWRRAGETAEASEDPGCSPAGESI
jgi:hypothetical protein